MTRPGLSLLILASLLPGFTATAATPPHTGSTAAPAPAAVTMTSAKAATQAAPASSAATPAAASMTAAASAQPALAGTAADTAKSPAPVPETAPASLPTRGMDMANVEHIYGEPLKKLAPVPAKGTPQHPPITRWIYPGFVVYFEYTHVVHAVVKSQPFDDTAAHSG